MISETKYLWDKNLKPGTSVKLITRKGRRYTTVKGEVVSMKNGKLVIKGKGGKEYTRKEPQRIFLKEMKKINEKSKYSYWHKQIPNPYDDPGWEHEKKRIDSMSDQALAARINKIGSGKKLYLFAMALEDENYHDLAEKAFDRLETMSIEEVKTFAEIIKECHISQ